MVSSFSNRSQQDIVAKMVGQIIGSTGNVTDFSEGSVIRSLVEAIAQEFMQITVFFPKDLLRPFLHQYDKRLTFL
jgi:hypothetical protein